MNIVTTMRILGILLMLFSITMMPSILISVLYKDGADLAFVTAMAISFFTGFFAWLPVRNVRKELRTRDGFLVVVLFWTVLSLFGSLPIYLAEHPGLSFTDSVFESVSALSTTGATVITGLDFLPESLLFYRQLLQWLGGMGIIVLAVAILPMLGIGGMQLYRAETPGPVKDNKLTPRITETAKALWYIYLTLTILCAGAYWLAGMSLFDAVSHSFSTVAIGGFSTHDASIGYFDSPAIEAICVVFMLISALNFSLHFVAWRERSLRHYLFDPEFRFFFFLLGLTVTSAIAVLWATDTYSLGTSIRHGIFEVVSVATTTGFGVADFSQWPGVLPFTLFLAAFVGGCAGSTGGGMKVVRILLILKQGIREIKRLIHPSAIIPVKLAGRSVPDRVIEAVWGFFSVYLMLFVIMLIILLATGLDQVTAWSAVGSALNNLGPGLGEVASHYGNIPDLAKWILIIAMLLGRLEIFTLLVLFTPMFWRR